MVQQTNTRNIFNITSNIKNGAASEMRQLAANFQPGALDVICRRGKTAYNHNKHFRDLIEKHLQKYSQASSKLEKSLVVSDVVDTIRENSPMGGFVRCIDGVWYEVGDSIAREKCGGSFRDMLHTQYKSSTKAKKRRRQEAEEREANGSVSVNSQPTTTIREQPAPAPTSAPVEQPKKHVVAATTEPSTKRRRVEAVVSPATLPPLSPKSTKVLCAFGDLLKDIQTRKQQVLANTTTSSSITDSPTLPPKKPLLPPPASFPAAPKSISIVRGCSVESNLSFDLNEMEEMDEFDLGLSRFTSVASAATMFSFQAPVL